MMKVAASSLMVLTACTSKPDIAPDIHAEEARTIERMCELPSGSLKLVDNEIHVRTDPPKAYNKVGCIIAEMQKRGLAGHVGLISEPPTDSEAK